MGDHDDQRRVLRFIAENGGPPATVNVVSRSGELGLEPDQIGEIVDALEDRQLVEVLADGDVHLTSFGRALVDSPDT
jgi:hypothetical protein